MKMVVLVEDEKRFLDRSATVVLLVDEERTLFSSTVTD